MSSASKALEMSEGSRKSSAAYRDGDVVLRDGSTVRVRLMRAQDEPKLVRLFQSLSDQDRWFRFFAPTKDSALAVEAHREATLDQSFALVASSGSDDRIVGHAFYAVIEAGRAEVAFTIAHEFQGRGLATILLGQLAEVAAANGIDLEKIGPGMSKEDLERARQEILRVATQTLRSA